MIKLSVKEYAIKYLISTQAVYNKIKKGLLISIQEDNKTFVYDEVKEVQPTLKDDCSKLVKQLLKQNKQLMKDNRKLNKLLSKEHNKSQALLLAYVDEMKALYLPNTKTKKAKKKKSQGANNE